MTHKKHAEHHEEKPKPAEGKDSSEHSAAGAVIHGDAQQKEFSAAHENSHARDKSPSHLHLPTPGNNFKIVGEEHATDRSGKDRKSPPNIRSVTEKELEVKASGGDQYAAFFLKERKNIIDNLPAGEERERALARIQSSADKMFGQKVKESNLKSTQDSEREESTDKFSEKSDDNEDATLDKKSLMSTKEMKVLGETNSVAAAGSAMLDATEDPGVREAIKKDIAEVIGQQSGPLNETPNRAVIGSGGHIKLVINAVDNVDENTAVASTSSASASEWQTALSQLSKLPLEKQLQIVDLGVRTFDTAWKQEQTEVMLGSTTGLVQGVGNILYDLASTKILSEPTQFIMDMATNNPRYLKTADEFGQRIGETLVSGVEVYRLLASYSSNVLKAGDYSAPIKDISTISTEIASALPAVGKEIVDKILHDRDELDKEWQTLSTRERARHASLFLTELGPNLLPGISALKFAKTEKLIATLENIGSKMSKLDPGSKDNFIGGVKHLVGDLIEQKTLISKTESAVIRRSEMLSDSVKNESAKEILDSLKKLPEHVSDQFHSEFFAQVSKLAPFELNILKKLHIMQPAVSLAGERRDADLATTLGAFIKENMQNKLYVGEYVRKGSEWMKTENVAFTFKHELGHALNVLYKDFAEPLSTRPKFARACTREFSALSEGMKYTLFSRFAVRNELTKELVLDSNNRVQYQMDGVWDEVFADGFGHVQSEVAATESYNLLIKENFQKSILEVQNIVKEISEALVDEGKK